MLFHDKNLNDDENALNTRFIFESSANYWIELNDMLLRNKDFLRTS